MASLDKPVERGLDEKGESQIEAVVRRVLDSFELRGGDGPGRDPRVEIIDGIPIKTLEIHPL